jgi:type VI secretion system secreted protein VgrG
MSPLGLAALRRSDAPTHNPGQNKDKKHWIEIELVDEDGNPVPGEPYRITLPDGSTVADGTLNEKGWARVDHIDPGTCQVTFPNLDKDAWEPK